MAKDVMISGGFDPLHCGHLALIREARSIAGPGAMVYCVVDSDEYVSSKHRLQQPQIERLEIIRSLKDVNEAVSGNTKDGNCNDWLEVLRPDIYLVGPDKTDLSNIPEFNYCEAIHIEVRRALNPRTKDWHSSKIIVPYKNPIVTISCILKNFKEEVLVSVRGIEDGRGTIELPGGFLEINEELEEGVRREVREELGVGIDQLEYFSSFPGKYSDGRDLLSIYFHGYINGYPECSPESLGITWCSKVPMEPFFNVVDRQALTEYLGDR